MPTRDEMNRAGEPFLALVCPAAGVDGWNISLDDAKARIADQDQLIADLEAALLRADQTNTRILEVNATLMSEAREHRGIALRLSRENERLREQVAMMAEAERIERIAELEGAMGAMVQRCEALEVAKRDADLRAGEWEMIAKLKATRAEDLRDETLRLSIDASVLNTLLEEQRRIAKRIARETPASFPAPRQADDL